MKSKLVLWEKKRSEFQAVIAHLRRKSLLDTVLGGKRQQVNTLRTRLDALIPKYDAERTAYDDSVRMFSAKSNEVASAADELRDVEERLQTLRR